MKPKEEAAQAAKRTMPLWPDAGQALGLSKNSTYEAARRGDIPTIRMGRRILVPIARFERLLSGEAA